MILSHQRVNTLRYRIRISCRTTVSGVNQELLIAYRLTVIDCCLPPFPLFLVGGEISLSLSFHFAGKLKCNRCYDRRNQSTRRAEMHEEYHEVRTHNSTTLP